MLSDWHCTNPAHCHPSYHNPIGYVLSPLVYGINTMANVVRTGSCLW